MARKSLRRAENGLKCHISWWKAGKLREMNINFRKCEIPQSCKELCRCCTGLKNAREVPWLEDYVPKLACAAEQAQTRSHLVHSVLFDEYDAGTWYSDSYLTLLILKEGLGLEARTRRRWQWDRLGPHIKGKYITVKRSHTAILCKIYNVINSFLTFIATFTLAPLKKTLKRANLTFLIISCISNSVFNKSWRGGCFVFQIHRH